MNQSFLSQIREMNQMTDNDIINHPNLITVKALKKSLIEKSSNSSSDVKFANEVVTQMVIDVNQNFLENKEEFNEVIEIFADLIIRFKRIEKEEELEGFLKSKLKETSLTYSL